MLETTDPEIDVLALLRRVRRVASADPASPGDGAPDRDHELSRRLAALPVVPPPPQMPAGRDEATERTHPVDFDGPAAPETRFTTMLADLLERADAKTRVDPGTSGFMRPLRRNQGGFNGILLEIMQELVTAHSHLSREVGALRGEVIQQSRQLTQQSLQLDAHHAWVAAFLGGEASRRAWAEGMQGVSAELTSRVVEGERVVRGVRAETLALRELAQTAAVETGRVQREWPGWQARVEDLAARCVTLETLEDPVGPLRMDLDALRGEVERHATNREEINVRLETLRAELDELRGTVTVIHGRQDPEDPVGPLRMDLDALRGEVERHATNREEINVRLETLRAELDELRGTVTVIHGRQDLEAMGEHLRNLQASVDGLRERADGADGRAQRLREHLGDLQGRTEGLGRNVEGSRAWEQRLDELQAGTNRAGEHLRALQEHADHLRAALDAEIHARESLHGIVSSLPSSFEGLRRDLERLDERQIADGSFLKAELALNRRPAQITPAPDAAALPEHSPEDGGHALDAFYVAFENEFRGSRDLVRERLRVYLPDLERVGAGSEDRPVLDLGCGRGEWLELLRENGHAAVRGVDLNGAMVAECQARGLDVQLADALAFLRGLPSDSLGAVTAFHLIEHVPFQVLLDLLAQTHRVLRPGGLAIFESPNCKNLVVGSCNFYSDPTHRNPVFPDTAGFMLRSQGFARAEVRYLRPVEGSPFDPTRPDGAALHGWFFGPRDFAVLGHKAGSSPAEHAGS